MEAKAGQSEAHDDQYKDYRIKRTGSTSLKFK